MKNNLTCSVLGRSKVLQMPLLVASQIFLALSVIKIALMGDFGHRWELLQEFSSLYSLEVWENPLLLDEILYSI